ncbi:MAG TPA: hypothetical protein ENK57_12265 [Polyangiaceae bacterium]|nr:hypothetical protein [Polyangiaceae bacterium]
MGELVSQPGIDPRSWIQLARVDDDDDAIRWSGADGDDGPLGWIVDVTIQGGDLDQESEIPCRLGAAYARDGELVSHPPARGCLVLVAMPCGNLNTEPTIIGELPTDGCAPPSSVNGTDVDEAYALATHFLVTSLDVDEQIGGDRRVKTGDGKTHRILGDAIELADEGASQSFVRGDDQQGALDGWYDAFVTWIELVRLGIVAGGGSLDNTAITTATNTLKTQLEQALSTKIKGA